MADGRDFFQFFARKWRGVKRIGTQNVAKLYFDFLGEDLPGF